MPPDDAEGAVALAARSTKGLPPKKRYIRESAVEGYLQTGVEARGGLCEKYVSPGTRGVPDRLITWPFIGMELAETKAPKGPIKPHQVRDHKKRAKLGVKVQLLYTRADCDAYFKVIDGLLSLV